MCGYARTTPAQCPALPRFLTAVQSVHGLFPARIFRLIADSFYLRIVSLSGTFSFCSAVMIASIPAAAPRLRVPGPRCHWPIRPVGPCRGRPARRCPAHGQFTRLLGGLPRSLTVNVRLLGAMRRSAARPARPSVCLAEALGRSHAKREPPCAVENEGRAWHP